MNNSNNNNKRTATLKAIMRMTFMTLLLMPLGEWGNNGNDMEGNVQQHTIKAQTMCKYHFHVHRPPRHIHRSSSRNHNNSQAKSNNTSLQIKQRISTWYKETRRKHALNQAMKNYANDNSTVVTIGRQAKFNRTLRQQQKYKGDKTIPTKEDIRRGFYIKPQNTTAWKPKPQTAWNINNTSAAWTTTTNTWLKLLVINALCNNNAQAMRHYRHDGTTMTWDVDTTNTATAITTTIKEGKGQQTMEETMACITSIIVALFIITMAAINLRANKKLKERKELEEKE